MTIKLHPYQIAAVEAIKKMGPTVVMEIPSRHLPLSLPRASKPKQTMILCPQTHAIARDIVERGATLDHETFAARMRAFFASHDKQKGN